MIDKSRFNNQEFLTRALALPFSEVVRHASVVVDNTTCAPELDTDSFAGVCLELVTVAAERLRVVEPRIRFYVQGARWFDGTNTYHSVRISDANMDEIACVPFSYGYGDHYMQTAFQWFRENGFVPDEMTSHNVSIFFREQLRASYSVRDVKRKKDL